MREAEELRAKIVPDDMELIVTRNYGLTANEKVNELVEGLAVAVLIVVALLTLGLGWREALIVAVAVPVVFGLTLAVNLMLGFTINRVTLFALILSLGLLVDDPIVDVENIARHFTLRKKATRADRAGGRGRDSPAADHRHAGGDRQFPADVLHHRHDGAVHAADGAERAGDDAHVDGRGVHDHALAGVPRAPAEIQRRRHGEAMTTHDPDDLDALKQSRLYKVFYPLMAPLLHSRLGGLVVPARHGPADGRGDGAGGPAQRAAEDAAVRQQERTAARARLRRGHDAGTLRRGRARLRGVPGRRAGGHRLHQLRRAGLADGFQRPGAALLSPPGRQRGRGADQPGRQEEPPAAEPRHRPADAQTICRRSPTGTAHA